MTEREALKLALEALEANQPINYCMNNNGEKFPMMQEDPFRFERNIKAITACKEALAKPEQEPVADQPLPCPFCGHIGLDFSDGDTYRWGIASCGGCGASCGDIRREYPDEGKWHSEAIAEWNRRTTPPQPEQKPVAWRAWFDADNGARWLFSLWPEEERLNVEWTPLYTTPPQPEQSQVEETLRYEIDALEAKLAECRAQQQESVAKRLMDCNDCGGTGVDGDVDDRGLTIDVECRSCAGSGKSRYFGSCTNGGRCLQGCLNTEGCYWEKRVAKVQPEPVIDKSAATRIATALGWEPKRKPLTDEEISDLWDEVVKYAPSEVRIKDFARAIEAAHGIKE